jgi:hypothetical protein
MHSKYGEGTVLLREGDGEDAKLTVLFARHGMKKLMEKFANLRYALNLSISFPYVIGVLTV